MQELKQEIFLLFILLLGLSSCTNSESDIGSSFFESHANVVTIDTLTVNMQTVYLDSVTTSGSGVILLGACLNSVSGNKKASSYLQLGAPDVQTIATTAVYDSLCFIMKPNRYVIGDTTQPFSFSIHPLTEYIDPAENESSLYNNSSFSFDASPLGKWRGMIYPTKTDTISVRLSNTFGMQLFSAIASHSNFISTDDLFSHNFLKGLVLKGENNKAVFGFLANDSSAFMRLYYHKENNVKNPLYVDFMITKTSLQFNHIDNDKSGTAFAQLNSNNKTISADASNGISVTQPLSNLAIRLSFPYLQNLVHLGQYVKILGGTIQLYPEPGSYSADNPLPSSLALCRITDYYTVVDSLTYGSSVAYGNLVKDYNYKDSYYTYSLAEYLTSEISKTNNNYKTKLLLIPPASAYHTTFQQLVLDNKSIKASVQIAMYNAE